MAGPGLSLLNLARAMKLAALLMFLLPWSTVSCSSGALGDVGQFRMSGAPSEDIARATGLQLATGTAHFIQTPPAAGPAESANPFERPDPAAIAAGMLIALGFGLSFLPGLRGKLAALAAVTSAGATLCYLMFARLPRTAQDYVLTLIAREAGNAPAADAPKLAQMIEVRPEAGFWLTLVALAAAALLLALSARNRALPPA